MGYLWCRRDLNIPERALTEPYKCCYCDTQADFTSTELLVQVAFAMSFQNK